MTRAGESGQMDNIGDIATLSGVLKRASISAEPQMASVPGAILNICWTLQPAHGYATAWCYSASATIMHALMHGLT